MEKWPPLTIKHLFQEELRGHVMFFSNLSNEKNLGFFLAYIGEYATQLCEDHDKYDNKPLQGFLWINQYGGK